MNDWQNGGREMPGSIDWPKDGQPHRRRKLLFFLVVVAGLLFAGWSVLSYWVDLLWFESLGYRNVFWKTLTLQYGTFAVFMTVTFLIVYGTFSALKRAHQADLPIGQKIVIGGQPVNFSVEPVLRIAAF